MKHYTVDFQPDNLTIAIHAGATLLDAAGQAGLILSTPCGGIGRCGKCKVQLLPSGKEVCACQYTIEHDLTVSIPDSSRFFKQKILEHGIQPEIGVTSSIKKVFAPDPVSQINAFCEMLSQGVSAQVTVTTALKEALSAQLMTCQGNEVTAILSVDLCSEQSPHYKLMGIESGDTTGIQYGVAADIGTTTVVIRLVDLKTGEIVGTASKGNPQSQFGDDVVSRISYCENELGSDRLHAVMVSCLNELIESVSHQAGIQYDDIYEMTVVGNTTMNHLLLKHPVQQLGQTPYQAHSLVAENHRPGELGININSAGNIHTLANIAGFVGSDTVAATLACGLDIAEANTLLVDIGTNGEIVWGTESHLLAASCAAGPALEGAGITFGSRGQSGAIERVVFNDEEIDVDVIGNVQATSLCGSGLIDAVAVLLELGIIDSTGRFCDRCEMDPMLPDTIRKRYITYNDEPAFVLAGNFAGGQWENMVLLTQKDLRQLQLAKAAIRAGIELLLNKAGNSIPEIQQLLLAGAFGNYIQKKSAVRIGLLPPIPLEKIHFVGNAAGSGAQMALISQDARTTAIKLAEKTDYIEIAHQADFQTVFSEFLLFPEN
ncbi:MAG: ASKHA domain-containing protein [Planctomycetota bacterium]|jgi:uncharacterized 2Fe-2S/4Fe-4S cluster protein (DUF4445 family)